MNFETIDHTSLSTLLERKVAEVIAEPAFHWQSGFRPFMTDGGGAPLVRAAVANCRLDTDIWEGLRNPAQVGMYPLTFADIWKHYAAAYLESTREDGSEAPLAMPESFEDASRRFKRVVLVSAMVAVNPEVFEAYAKKVGDGDEDPFDYYDRAAKDVSDIVDKGLNKVALVLMAPDRAVIPMTKTKVQVIVERTRAEYLTGRYHGPCNSHWPQNSVAVMTGLLRFGIHRLPFRDEVTADGERRRLIGRYCSMVVFDGEEPVTDGAGGLALIDAERLAWKRKVNDYTVTDAAVAGERYCTYNAVGTDGASVCGKCLEGCPSGALKNSSPGPDGRLEERIAGQQHRFADGALDFDWRKCSRDRTQKKMLFDDYECARCEVLCAVEGVRKSKAEIRAINGG